MKILNVKQLAYTLVALHNISNNPNGKSIYFHNMMQLKERGLTIDMMLDIEQERYQDFRKMASI
jgi:hypothetical protein